MSSMVDINHEMNSRRSSWLWNRGSEAVALAEQRAERLGLGEDAGEQALEYLLPTSQQDVQVIGLRHDSSGHG